MGRPTLPIYCIVSSGQFPRPSNGTVSIRRFPKKSWCHNQTEGVSDFSGSHLLTGCYSLWLGCLHSSAVGMGSLTRPRLRLWLREANPMAICVCADRPRPAVLPTGFSLNSAPPPPPKGLASCCFLFCQPKGSGSSML